MSLFSASFHTKRDWLQAEVKAVLDAFGYGDFIVVVHPDPELIKNEAGTVADINRRMGEPIRYARIRNALFEEFGPLNVANSLAETEHSFDVMLWFELTGEDSQAQFDLLIENHDLGGMPTGLLPHLRRAGSFQANDAECTVVKVGKPREGIIHEVEILASDAKLYAHYLEFTISLT